MTAIKTRHFGTTASAQRGRGFAAHLVKPIDVHQLDALLRAIAEPA